MADLPVLNAEEQRVLGALLEKEWTVPASYPLSLSGLRGACNQTSSREPVVDYDDSTIEAIIKRLRARELIRVVWADRGPRTLKYHQVLAELLDLPDDERALITVLLLRGPQAPGALKTRAERLHGFADRHEVEACLARLAARPEPLVRELPRQPGQQDLRWVHELGPVDTGAPGAAPGTAVDREGVLADGVEARDGRIRATYDTVATSYADQLVDELEDQPFERWLLDRVAAHADGADGGPVVEVGCGPGHVTAYLAAAGADASGIDLSPTMVAEARARFPDGSYDVGDLRRLMRPATSGGWAAVLGWYSLIHLAESELPDALASLVRPLAPGGWLVLALHAGDRIERFDEWFGHEVSIDVVLQDRVAVVGVVEAAGLVDVEWYLHGPHRVRDEATQRLYVIGRKPG